ncbi:hypothetical protein SLS53_000367 [Cytospora paraplurivora]|uniref:Uncharacterized protein n=1 Tax=Cytospora paraplurivora TaxID=2898453 RepID=A0AAN9ULT0_9PEZI
MDNCTRTSDQNDPSLDDPYPRRPPGLPRSNTFGELSPPNTLQAQDSLPTLVGVALNHEEIDTKDGIYICASLHRQSGSSDSDSENNSEVAGGNQYSDLEMQTQQKREDIEHRPLGGYIGTGQGEGGEEEVDEHEEGADPVDMGIARVAHIVTPGTVSMVEIRRRKPGPLMPSRSVRDVASLPDLAWAQSLTTASGRSVASVASVASMDSGKSVRVPQTLGDANKKVPSPPTTTITLTKRKRSRKLLKKKKVKEWCERGMGMGSASASASGVFGPYAGTC